MSKFEQSLEKNRRALERVAARHRTGYEEQYRTALVAEDRDARVRTVSLLASPASPLHDLETEFVRAGGSLAGHGFRTVSTRPFAEMFLAHAAVVRPGGSKSTTPSMARMSDEEQAVFHAAVDATDRLLRRFTLAQMVESLVATPGRYERTSSARIKQVDVLLTGLGAEPRRSLGRSTALELIEAADESEVIANVLATRLSQSLGIDRAVLAGHHESARWIATAKAAELLRELGLDSRQAKQQLLHGDEPLSLGEPPNAAMAL